MSELPIEIVHDNAEDKGYVSMLLDISDRPVFIVAPLEYKINGMNDEMLIH